MKYSFLIVIIFALIINAQPKNEVRAVWITTAFNLDWPTTQGSENQRREINDILDSLKLANFNTIYLQVRARGDLLYPSIYEPFAKSLTGKLGKDPGYDPLKYFIEESHEKGIEIHAWWNVYKVFGKELPGMTKPKHVVLDKPELCKYYKNEWWMDPGIPNTNKYLLKLIIELLTKYDIDGINFDYMRYPDEDFPDDLSFEKYGKGIDKYKWRRENINNFVSQIYDSVNSLKPYLKVGSSPLGIYKNNFAKSFFFEGYYNASQDSKKWIETGKQDYISPQLFWNIDSIPNYNVLLREWISNAGGRQVIPGIAAYKLLPETKDWNLSEISAQIDSIRKIGAEGISIYRLSNLRNNDKGIYDLLKDDKFKNAAGISPLTWKDTTKPEPPKDFELNFNQKDKLYISFTGSLKQEIKLFNIYLSKTIPVDITDIKNIYRLRVTNLDTVIIDKKYISSKPDYLTVTALSRTNAESNNSDYVVIRKRKLLGLTVLQINNKSYFLNEVKLSQPIQQEYLK